MLKREQFAGASPAAHDFVADQQDAVLLQECLESLEITLRRRQDAVSASDGLNEHRRNVLRSLVLDHFFQVLQVVGDDFLVGASEAEFIGLRVHDAHHTGHAGLRRPAPWVASEADGPVGRSVVTAIAHQDLVAPREHAHCLDGVLVRFRTTEGVEERVQVTGNQFCQAHREFRADLGCHAGVGIRQRGGLILNGFDHLGMAVADVHAHQLTVEIDPALSFGSVQVDALGAHDRQWINFASRAPREQAVLLARVDHFTRTHVPSGCVGSMGCVGVLGGVHDVCGFQLIQL